jgi:hypothetical protein
MAGAETTWRQSQLRGREMMVVHRIRSKLTCPIPMKMEVSDSDRL